LRFDLAVDRFPSLNDELCAVGRSHMQKLPRLMDKGNPLKGVLFRI